MMPHGERRHVRIPGAEATLCGRKITTDGGHLEVWPEMTLARQEHDLIAWAWASCSRCRQVMANEEKAREPPQPIPFRDRPGPAKLSTAEVEKIFRLRAEGLTQQAIAERMQVNATTISRILRQGRRAAA